MMTSNNVDISNSKKIKEAFTKLCSAYGITTDGALSAVPDKHGRNLTITLDLFRMKNDDLWMDIQTVERKLKKIGFIDAKVNWECVADETRSYQLPKSLTLTMPNCKYSAATIEAMYNSQANNSPAASDKTSSGNNNGAGNDGNSMHSVRIKPPRKRAQEKDVAPKNAATQSALDKYLQRPQNAWVKG